MACSFYLHDLSHEVRRASVRNVRLGPMLVICDGVDMAYMGHPFAPYLSLGIFPEPFNQLLETRWSLLAKIPCFGFFHVPPGEAESRLCVVMLWFSRPACSSGGPYPGHVLSYQAAFCLTRRCSVGHCASHQSRCFPSFPIRIEWGKGESFSL